MSWAEERAKLLGSDDPAELLGINDAVRTDVTEKLREAAGLYRRAAAELRDAAWTAYGKRLSLMLKRLRRLLRRQRKAVWKIRRNF